MQDKNSAHTVDHESDPAHTPGHGWGEEGGASHLGPATNTGLDTDEAADADEDAEGD